MNESRNKTVTNRLLVLCMFVIFALVISVTALVSTKDTTVTPPVVDTTATENPTVDISNETAIESFFEKLNAMQGSSKGKVRIVHIGDSHIQADLLSSKIRNELHASYGNAGFGFAAPLSLAKTNGSWSIQFRSGNSWSSYRNVLPVNEKTSAVGLSGMVITTQNPDFAIEIQVKDTAFTFNRLSVISPFADNSFQIALDRTAHTTTEKKTAPAKVVHKIKSGETLSSLAQKYSVSVTEIKKANGMNSTLLKAGKSVTIPNQGTQVVAKSSVTYSYDNTRSMEFQNSVHSYYSDNLMKNLFIRPANSSTPFGINGFVFERNQSGVLYSNIGINGAMISDYNKTGLFFSQLPALSPDLVIISLGTNESFGEVPADQFILQLDTMIDNIRKANSGTSILVTTPPPSQLRKRQRNHFIDDYSSRIIAHAETRGYAVWDMYAQFGKDAKIESMIQKGFLRKDRVHYSKEGYYAQGTFFVDALRYSYTRFNVKKAQEQQREIDSIKKEIVTEVSIPLVTDSVIPETKPIVVEHEKPMRESFKHLKKSDRNK